ncbi:28257_t:CDS:2, partial [Gigaspora margarita]
ILRLVMENLDQDSISLKPVYNLIELGLEEYEENELVLNAIHDLMQFFEQSNCTCRHAPKRRDLRTCYEKVGFKRFFERYFQVKALEKSELELFLKAQLIAFEITNDKLEAHQKHNYRYCYNYSFPLCKPAFLKLYGINEYFLSAMQEHLQNEGLTERIHGNTGRVPKVKSKVFLDSSVTFPVKHFLEQYGAINGLPSPMRHKSESEPFIYLSTSSTYVSVYNEFKKHFYSENNQDEAIISYYTFRKLWQETIPHLKFQSPASDLCEVCETFKAKLLVAKSDKDEYDQIKVQYDQHREAADREKQHYNNNINESAKDLSIVHVCYDWAQSISIPYSPQQVGTIYFKTPFSVSLFGVCKTEGGQNSQLNFAIGENEFPEGWYEEITVNFMIPGHTKFICDSFFGKIKKLYRTRKINILTDIEQVINDSSKGNTAILYKNKLGWTWNDFSLLFKDHFKNFPHIKQYHHFRFNNSPNNIGKVYASTESGGTEISFQLLCDSNFNINTTLKTINTKPLTKERKSYLYTKIRQHVDDPYKD